MEEEGLMAEGCTAPPGTRNVDNQSEDKELIGCELGGDWEQCDKGVSTGA